MLDLPVSTVVEEAPLHDQIQDGLDLIKRLSPKGKARRVRKPPWQFKTPYTIALIVTNSVILSVFAVFVLMLVLSKP